MSELPPAQPLPLTGFPSGLGTARGGLAQTPVQVAALPDAWVVGGSEKLR